MTSNLDTSFGYQAVETSERRARIRRVFARVANRYDLMNDLMSMGLHRIWKRGFVKAVEAKAAGTIVDLAGGTGDIAIALASASRKVIVCDPSLEMMDAGRKRNAKGVSWIAGEAEALPFQSGSLDCVTISFGIRNVTSLDRALAEIVRVLKPGGRFLCLEFSTPRPWLKPFYDVYSYLVIPRLGAAVAGTREAYVYLVESIRRFPDQEEFKGAFERAGFVDVSYRNFTFGIVCLHAGRKPLKNR
jgi:demethylmenaquinone methyltransferase / 2-methoxy-6-polyprenyl-1,4-benzoquinol methylase